MAFPEHTGLLLPATGDDGIVFTVTLVVEAEELQPLTETVNEYVPAKPATALDRVGSSRAEVNPLGPVQE